MNCIICRTYVPRHHPQVRLGILLIPPEVKQINAKSVRERERQRERERERERERRREGESGRKRERD